MVRAETPEGQWRGVFQTGAVAAWAAAVVLLAGIAGFAAWPTPTDGNAASWLNLLASQPLRGAVALDAAMLLGNLVAIPVVLALYVALHRQAESLLALAAVLWLVGLTTYFASSQVLDLLALARQAAAAGPGGQAPFLGAAQAMLTGYLGAGATPATASGWNYGGTAFTVAFLLSNVGMVLVSVALLRSRAFLRATGWLGVLAGVLALGLVIPVAGIYLAAAALPFILAWYALVGLGLWRLAGATRVARAPVGVLKPG